MSSARQNPLQSKIHNS